MGWFAAWRRIVRLGFVCSVWRRCREGRSTAVVDAASGCAYLWPFNCTAVVRLSDLRIMTANAPVNLGRCPAVVARRNAARVGLLYAVVSSVLTLAAAAALHADAKSGVGDVLHDGAPCCRHGRPAASDVETADSDGEPDDGRRRSGRHHDCGDSDDGETETEDEQDPDVRTGVSVALSRGCVKSSCRRDVRRGAAALAYIGDLFRPPRLG